VSPSPIPVEIVGWSQHITDRLELVWWAGLLVAGALLLLITAIALNALLRR
jgi:hypothetical protein